MVAGTAVQCAAEISFEPGKPAQFLGDAAGIACLNTDAELLKQANGFLRQSMAVSGITAKIEPFLRLIPQQGSGLLLAHTLPKGINFGFAAVLDSTTFFAIAARIEQNLHRSGVQISGGV